MPSKIKHAYAVGDRVTLVSGRVVLITKLRRTPGADVSFSPIRNQPWYEGTDVLKNVQTFPQTSVVQKFEEGYPKDVPGRVRRVHAEKAAKEKVRASLEQDLHEGILVVWPINEADEAYDCAGREIAKKLLNDAPGAVTTEVLYSLLEFAVNCGEFKLLPDSVNPGIRRYLKKVRDNQAALR